MLFSGSSWAMRLADLPVALALLLAAPPAHSLEQGDFQAGLYTAPGQFFTVKSPLGASPYLVDSFDRTTGAVTFFDASGQLFGVICTPNFDVLAGADNDFETNAAILRNWLHEATFPLFFERQLPGASIQREGPGEFEGEPAWIAVLHLPRGSSMLRTDPITGQSVREDSWRGLVVFSRGDHTYLIMTEATPEADSGLFLPKLSEFYRGINFTPSQPTLADQTLSGNQHAGT